MMEIFLEKKNKFKNSFTKKNIEKNNLLIIKSIKKKFIFTTLY